MRGRPLALAWIVAAVVLVLLVGVALAQWRSLASRGQRAAAASGCSSPTRSGRRRSEIVGFMRANVGLLQEMQWTSAGGDPAAFLTRLAELAREKRMKVIGIGPLERSATAQFNKSWHTIQIVAPYRELRDLAGARGGGEGHPRGRQRDGGQGCGPAGRPARGRDRGALQDDRARADPGRAQGVRARGGRQRRRGGGRDRPPRWRCPCPARRPRRSGAARAIPSPPPPRCRPPGAVGTGHAPAGTPPGAPPGGSAGEPERPARAEGDRRLSRRLSRHREQSDRQDRRYRRWDTASSGSPRTSVRASRTGRRHPTVSASRTELTAPPGGPRR